MASKGKIWTREEIEQAIALYLVTPFGKIDRKNPNIITLADKLGRTASSIALKMANLASIDETLDRKGMDGHSKLDKQVWNEFFNKLKTISPTLDSDHLEYVQDGFQEIPQAEFDTNNFQGTDILTISTARQGQQVFRNIVLATYDHQCAVSGINQTELLIAGHISRWAEDPQNRLNPRNGILLNRLHDKAFEDGLITFEDNGEILYSKKLKEETLLRMKEMSPNGHLLLPEKFKPDPSLLRIHRETRFAE